MATGLKEEGHGIHTHTHTNTQRGMCVYTHTHTHTGRERVMRGATTKSVRYRVRLSAGGVYSWWFPEQATPADAYSGTSDHRPQHVAIDLRSELNQSSDSISTHCPRPAPSPPAASACLHPPPPQECPAWDIIPPYHIRVS